VEPVLRAPFYLEVLLTIAEDTGVWQGCLLGDFGKCLRARRKNLSCTVQVWRAKIKCVVLPDCCDSFVGPENELRETIVNECIAMIKKRPSLVLVTECLPLIGADLTN
jgi:hypothetical protein